MFLLEFVILFTVGWGCLPQCMLGYHTPRSRHIPPRQPLQWTICILLECILVLSRFYRPQQQGNVFTPVCQSFCSQGGRGLSGRPRTETLPRTVTSVRILLECILVRGVFATGIILNRSTSSRIPKNMKIWSVHVPTNASTGWCESFSCCDCRYSSKSSVDVEVSTPDGFSICTDRVVFTATKTRKWRRETQFLHVAGSLLCGDIILQHLMTSFCNIWWHHFEWLAHFGFWINR